MLMRLILPVGLSIFLSISFATAASHDVGSVSTNELSERLMLNDGKKGVSCSQFLGNVLPWSRRGGDWRDASGKSFGNVPYATARPQGVATVWNVSTLVRGWLSAGDRNGIFFLRPVTGSGYARFHSREAKAVTDWPMLVLEFSNGHRELLKPTADSSIDCSTYTALGYAESLSVSGRHSAVLQFAMPTLTKGESLTRARLTLSNSAKGGMLDIGVFVADPPEFPSGTVVQGLAAEYPEDRGIERNPEVIFATGFDEPGDWKSRWAKGAYGRMDKVSDDPQLRFSALQGSALRVNLQQGSNLGMEVRLNLNDHGGEPDELYFRYYLRFADDWNPNVASGKLPGLAGTYGKAGWGGRRVHGDDGWSLRGMFVRSFPSDHPMSGLTQLATYAYHAEMSGLYGDNWLWPGALLARNRWYCIEQYVRLNRPGISDGILRVWVDGRLAMERSEIRMRNVDQLHIETVWLNAYHGGAEKSPQDQHLYIDNVVVARRYIGPMARQAVNPVGRAKK